MGWLTYLAIALVMIEADAVWCEMSGVRFRFWIALMLALMWPVVSVFIIVGVACKQKAERSQP